MPRKIPAEDATWSQVSKFALSFNGYAEIRPGPTPPVADRLGHKDAMVTSTVYTHVLAEQADQAANTFARVAGID